MTSLVWNELGAQLDQALWDPLERTEQQAGVAWKDAWVVQRQVRKELEGPSALETLAEV